MFWGVLWIEQKRKNKQTNKVVSSWLTKKKTIWSFLNMCCVLKECRSVSFALIVDLCAPVCVCMCMFIAQIHLTFGILCNTYVYLNWHRFFSSSHSSLSRTFCTPHFLCTHIVFIMYINTVHISAYILSMHKHIVCTCALCTVNISLHSYSMQVFNV